jgi:hypothetical protein
MTGRHVSYRVLGGGLPQGYPSPARVNRGSNYDSLGTLLRASSTLNSRNREADKVRSIGHLRVGQRESSRLIVNGASPRGSLPGGGAFYRLSKRKVKPRTSRSTVPLLVEGYGLVRGLPLTTPARYGARHWTMDSLSSSLSRSGSAVSALKTVSGTLWHSA